VTTSLDNAAYGVLPEVRALADSPQLMLIDGEFVESTGGERFATIDAATGERITEIAQAAPADVDRAVMAARRALDGPWSRIAPAERGRLIGALAGLIERQADELAQLEALDSGKPIAFARVVDVDMAIQQLRYYSGWPTKLEGQTLPVGTPDMHVYTRREPIGVVAAIVPWNFPLAIAVWKVAPALAAGCTVVLKPAEQTPLSALRLGALALEAGIPPGVLNVCPGDGEVTGAALAGHEGVDRIAFTGSTAVGRDIARAAAGTLAEVSLELGGKNPNIVLADADLSAAATGSAMAAFFNSGQVCGAGSRILVQREVHDDFVAELTAQARTFRVGPGLDPDTTLGPLISAEHHARVRGYVEDGVAGGATLLGGGQPDDEGLGNGYFLEPAVLAGVRDDDAVCREEIFGPVAVVQPFDTVDEAVTRANATPYGLTAGVWTTDVRNAHRFAAQLQAGTIWINGWGHFDPAVPFGGYKQSGYGRDSGRAALDEYLQVKAVWTNLA